MNNNLFSPLIDSMFSVGKALYKAYNRRIPKYIEYEPNIEYRIGNNLYIPIGVTSSGKQLNLVLDNSNHACLISGVSGSGKSTALHTIISGLLSYNVELYLLDYKVTELGIYSSLMQCKCYQYEVDAIEQTLSNILDSIKQEYKQLLAEGKTHSNPYGTVKVLIVEELSIATKKALQLLAQIVAIGRACNYRVICTIQRADSNTMNSQLKSLLTNRICFKQIDEANSKLVIYSDKASNINTVGRGYYLRDSELIEFQAYYMALESINKIVKSNSKNININSKVEEKVADKSWIDRL